MVLENVTILGSGGMGTALAIQLARSGHHVNLWGRRPEFIEQLEKDRVNSRYLPETLIPQSVRLTSDCNVDQSKTELILVAIPSAYLRQTLQAFGDQIRPSIPVISAVKGIEVETFQCASEVIREELHSKTVSVLSGPCHAEELAAGKPTSVVIAGTDDSFNRLARDTLNSRHFRVYSNDDRIGVELGGALKNVLGVAAGISDGLRMGDNAKAALLTRGLAEMTRFGLHFGARPATFLGLAGVGDLITTCYSGFGRNRSYGQRIGAGETLEMIRASTPKVAEGITTCQSVYKRSQALGISMPITATLHQILFDGKAPQDAVFDLMDRDPRDELT